MGNGTDDSDQPGPGVMSPEDDEGDNWVVDCSDDESYNPAGLPGPAWEPRPEVAKLLYERLSRGEPFILEWLCPGRRSPSPERLEDDEADLMEEPEETKQEERALPSGFDFDEDMDAPGMKPGFTPRRTPGSGQMPRSTKKRVARMDKIMNDILRHKKIEAAERKATPGRRLQGTPGGGQRKLSALGGQRRLLALGADRKGYGGASVGGGGDKSFTFGDDDDFGADVKKPAGSGGRGGFAGLAPLGLGLADVKTEAKLAAPTVAPTKEPTSTTLSGGITTPTTKTEMGEIAAVSAATSSSQMSALHSQPTPFTDVSTPSSKSSQSLSAQMGGLTCKPNSEIKKEPLGYGELPACAGPLSLPATPASTPTPPSTQPQLQPPPVEVKTEPGVEPIPPAAQIPTPLSTPATQTLPVAAALTDTTTSTGGDGVKPEPSDVTTGNAVSSQGEKMGADDAGTAVAPAPEMFAANSQT